MASAGKPIKKKLNLKDKLTDDNLDLSLCSLETVPIKEIVDLAKVKKLNLSYNLLTGLSDDFIKLQFIRELDLSKNKLKSLPKNFGCMANLKNLDLLGNELTALPASFCELKSLQWLDLKDNPLSLPLKQAAGDCLDVAQCKKCALNVIAYMKKVSIEEERQRQIDLKKKREEQLKLEEQEKAKAKEVKALKDQEREFRRRINEQKKKEIFADTSERKETNGKLDHSSEDRKQFAKSKSTTCHTLVTALLYLVLISSALVTVYLLLNNFCRGGNADFRQSLLKNEYVAFVMNKVDAHACPVFIKNRPVVEKFLKSYLD